MIAVGLLKKDGRKVVAGRPTAKKNTAKQSNDEEVVGLAQLVEKKDEKLKDKRRKLLETERKLESVRNLLIKNSDSPLNQ